MAVTISSVYKGSLNVENTHGPSGGIIHTTAPVDNGGTGELFSPTDLLATAMGSCMLTIMGKVAGSIGVNLEGASVKVTKHMAENPRRICMLEVVFALPDGLDEKARQKIVKGALTCPVKQSLHPDVEVVLDFNGTF